MHKVALVFALLWGTWAAGQTTVSSTPSSLTTFRTFACTAPTNTSFVLTGSSGSVPITAAIQYLANQYATADNPPVTYALSLNSMTTPAIVSVIGTPQANLIVGTSTANIVVSSPGQADLFIPLTTVLVAPPTYGSFPVPPFSVVQGSPQGNRRTATSTITDWGCPGTRNYALTVSPAGAWLSASASTIRMDNFPGSADLNVTVDATGLAPGLYSGSVQVDTTGYAPVSLRVYAAQLTAAPASMTFNQPFPSSPVTPQSIQVSNTGPSTPFTVSVDQGTNPASCGGTWLTATPGSGSTFATPVTVSYNAAGLASGIYSCNGTVTISSSDSTVAPAVVPVRLNVGGQFAITAGPTSPSFTITNGSPVTVPPLAVGISSTPAVPFAATASVTTPVGGNWLTVTAGGTTNSNIQIGIRPGASSLPAGTYNGSVTVTSNGSLGTPITIPVTLTVNPAPTLTVSALSAFGFYGLSPTASVQNLNVVTNTGTNLATPTLVSLTQLRTSAGTPSNLVKILTPVAYTPGTAAALPAGITFDPAVGNILPQGTYGGTIRVQDAGSVTTAPSFVDVSWSIVIASPPPMTAAPTAVNFTANFGVSPPTQSQNVSVTGPVLQSVSYLVSFSSIGNWLSATPSNGVTPGNVTVTANPAPGGTALVPGTYTGSVFLTATNLNSSFVTTIPVNLMVISHPAVAVLPASIFSSQQLGTITTNPLVLTADSPLSFTAVANASVPGWLSVSPASGTTSNPATVTINTATLAPLTTYSGQIAFTLGGNNGTFIVPVTVIPGSIGPCTITPASSTLALGAAGTAPNGLYPTASQTVTVTATSSCAQWIATSGSSWIHIVSSGANSFSFTALSNTQSVPRSATIALTPGGGLSSTTITVTEAASTESTNTRQVRALYQALLGREPDADGFNFWSGVGQAGLGQMGNAFLTSQENIDTGVQTLAIYRALLGRLPPLRNSG